MAPIISAKINSIIEVVKVTFSPEITLGKTYGINDQRKKTVIFVTHDIEEAILLADRIVFMRPGKIEAELTIPYCANADNHI